MGRKKSQQTSRKAIGISRLEDLCYYTRWVGSNFLSKAIGFLGQLDSPNLIKISRTRNKFKNSHSALPEAPLISSKLSELLILT